MGPVGSGKPGERGAAVPRVPPRDRSGGAAAPPARPQCDACDQTATANPIHPLSMTMDNPDVN
jgi:hypothetical protein